MAGIDMNFEIISPNDSRATSRECGFCGRRFRPYAIKMTHKPFAGNCTTIDPDRCCRCVVRIGLAVQKRFPYRVGKEPYLDEEPIELLLQPGKRKLLVINNS